MTRLCGGIILWLHEDAILTFQPWMSPYLNGGMPNCIPFVDQPLLRD